MSYSLSGNHGGPVYTIGGSSNDEAARRCALQFNPGGHEPTEKVKVFCTGAMKAIADERDRVRAEHLQRNEALERDGKRVPDDEIEAYNDAMRAFATAMTDIQKGSMMAVSGLHTRTNAGLT